MTTRVAPNLLRRINERRVLEVLQQQGPASRATVVRALGMTAPTVSKAVDSLLKHGLLEEQTHSNNLVGRPGKLLQIAVRAANVLGIVIDSRVGWVISSGLGGELHDERMRPFQIPASYTELLDVIQAHANDLMETLAIAPRAVGISVPGLVNLPEQRVALSPNLHILDGQRPAVDLAERLQIPCVMVQESHALCLGERMYGEAQGMQNFAMLDVSTGLGLGVMNRGQLLRGESGLAGELGHITVDPRGIACGCGNVGCLETVATDSAFVRRISDQLGRAVDLDEAVRLIRTGEINADKALAETCEFVAIAVAAVINIFNPSTLFLHGRLFEAADLLFDQVVERARQRSLIPAFADCTIRKARGSKRQGAIAGIVHHVTESWAPSIH